MLKVLGIIGIIIGVIIAFLVIFILVILGAVAITEAFDPTPEDPHDLAD